MLVSGACRSVVHAGQWCMLHGQRDHSVYTVSTHAVASLPSGFSNDALCLPFASTTGFGTPFFYELLLP